ncbi:hypothetical protein [Saccharopolyspora sp. MS10]|uniref:hypothetical protein n=1 Tax=Saccharopolyspora sp. MS10 TaxID=3385973 RepID=UPI0039A2448A
MKTLLLQIAEPVLQCATDRMRPAPVVVNDEIPLHDQRDEWTTPKAGEFTAT